MKNEISANKNNAVDGSGAMRLGQCMRQLAGAIALIGAVWVTGCAPDSAQAAAVIDDEVDQRSADDFYDAYLDEDRAAIAAWREREDDASVVEELAYRTERDQRIRHLILEMIQAPGAQPDNNTLTWLRLMQRMKGIDADNQRWIKRELEERDWFTISEYGAEADNDAFLIVQHATEDPEFMREIHTRFERLLPEGEIAPDNYALLTDRLAVMDGQPQPYGSQFECRNGVQSLQTPLVDPEPIVDERRAEVGLPTLAEYRALLPDCSNIPGNQG